MSTPDPDTARRIEQLSGAPAAGWRRIEGGYTPAERWVVRLADGRSAFAKIGTTLLTAAWVRDEHRWYRAIGGDFMPRMLGFDDHPGRPMLLLEDLSRAHWPPPWRSGDVERLLETLGRVAATRPLPGDLPPLERHRDHLSGWTRVGADPHPFLGLGLCSPEWLEDALPTLLVAQSEASLDGDDLVHFDVRSDNVCYVGDRTLLVDWNLPARGNGRFDLACLAPSLRMEGGPLPEEVLPDTAAFAALVSGYFASFAGLESIPDAPKVRWIQRRQLRIALPWAARALALPPPDVLWARDEAARVDEALEAGRITEEQWYELIEEVLGDAYLASDDPRAQSGKSGDEQEWRWARELILDVCRGGDAVLDVGCANGYLMESVERWAAERGVRLEVFGLDISGRLASLARRRLPRFADRIWVGNLLYWRPPRRFDVVHTGLDYVPAARRGQLIRHVLEELLAPGGRLVVRPERVGPDTPDVPAQLRRLGFEPEGLIEAVHPRTGEIRRTAWLRAGETPLG